MKLCAKDVSRVYLQGDKEILALNEVNLTVPKDCFSVIVGPSGCGKSTLLRTLAALEMPTQGSVFYDDTDVYRLSETKRSAYRRKKIGVVYQDYSLLPTLTALENICTPALMDGRRPDMAYIMHLCRTLGIEDRLHHIPSEMSGGEQQRTAVARALVNQPEILFADEPTGNLDKASAQELLQLLLLTKREFHQTLLMVTHDPEIAACADVQIRMDNGRIL